MLLQLPELLELQHIAEVAAKKAGVYIMSRFYDNFDVHRKGKGGSLASDVVTEVDINAQQIILEALRDSIKKYDLGLLAEESNDDGSRLIKDCFWTVDPLDGTLPFTKGSAGFSVAIALVSKAGDAIIGVVYDPYHKNLYKAVKGQKAYKNDKQLNITYHKNKGLTYYTDLSFTKTATYPYFIKALDNKSMTDYSYPLEEVVYQGAVLNGISVIENAPACYIKSIKERLGGGSAWDFAASSCIAKACGVVVTDYFGNEIHLNKKEHTFMNAEGVRFEVYQ